MIPHSTLRRRSLAEIIPDWPVLHKVPKERMEVGYAWQSSRHTCQLLIFEPFPLAHCFFLVDTFALPLRHFNFICFHLRPFLYMLSFLSHPLCAYCLLSLFLVMLSYPPILHLSTLRNGILHASCLQFRDNFLSPLLSFFFFHTLCIHAILHFIMLCDIASLISLDLQHLVVVTALKLTPSSTLKPNCC